MFKITALALVIALCNAEKDSSRLLLQAQPVPPPPPAQGVPPAQNGVPARTQPQPQQPGYNPYGPQPQPQQPAYNPYGQQPGYNPYNPYPQMNNMANPYCNPMSGQYDIQDCMQYGAFFGGGMAPGAAPGFGQAPGAAPGVGGARPGAASPINSMNPYCNPYSGMYDIQDCYQMTYGFNPF